ncbi:hypothetical protein F383_30077 [Gossypium arboreum]|uniref:Uncharacterized protein n=1 Tax=Gossypium arboreum TaxID=29729 RepID=A0A0B0PKL6_GOSAR|nr:hypothetical protein F383_30077 [Gossypium arboreum]
MPLTVLDYTLKDLVRTAVRRNDPDDVEAERGDF